MVAQNVWTTDPENKWKENGREMFSETRGKNMNWTEEDDNDYFLKGLLDGYIKEIDKLNRMRAKQEDKVKREFEVRMGEKEWRSEVRELIEKEVTTRLDFMKQNMDSMKQTIDYMNEDRRKLK